MARLLRSEVEYTPLGFLGVLQQLFELLGGLVVLAERFLDDGAVVLDLHRVRGNRLRFVQGVQGFVELPVAAVDLRDVQQTSGRPADRLRRSPCIAPARRRSDCR